MAELMVVPVSTSVLTPADTWETIISSCVGTVHPGDVICLTGEAAAITQNQYIRPEEMQPGFLERFFFRLLPEDDPFSNLYIMASYGNGREMENPDMAHSGASLRSGRL